MAITRHASETVGPTRPIQLLTIGNQTQVPAPLLRVSTCGLLTIEIVEEVVSTGPPLARYVSLTPEQLRGRGTAPALLLLKLFLNRHERFASRDWLMTQFCRDGELFSSVRIDNIVSLLRGLLCPTSFSELRTQLVAHVRGSTSSRDGFQLAAYPWIWVDSDALAWQVQQAARMERYGDDGLPFWERAYDLAKRGPYLPDEIDSDWTTFRRGEVAGMLRQSVQALARLYQARHGAAGEEEALLLLRSYWQEHRQEEDVLRPLMELLGRRECYHEALEYYEQLQKLLAQDDQQPDVQTQDLAEYVRTRQLQRHPGNSINISVHQYSQGIVHTTLLPTKASDTPSSSDMSAFFDQQSVLSTSPMAFAQMLSVELASEDIAIWLGIRLAHIVSLVQQWSKQALFCDILQAVIDREIAMFENVRETSTAALFTLSRRQALISLAALPTMLTALTQSQSYSVMPEEFLPQCAASITACWHLLRGQEFLLVEKILTRYLPTLADMSHQSSAHQLGAASLATQGYRLMGILALHHNNPQAQTAYWEQAVHFAEITANPNLLAAALTSLAYHNNDPQKAFLLYQRGIDSKQALSPLLLARLYARLAVTSAQQAQETNALEYLRLAQETYPHIPENDPTFLYAEFVPASMAMETGLTYLTLAQHGYPRQYAQQAWDTFAGVNSTHKSLFVPARTHYEVINHQARTTLVLDDIEAFCDRIEQGIHGAKLLRSNQRRQEALLLYKEARILWPDEARILSLGELFL